MKKVRRGRDVAVSASARALATKTKQKPDDAVEDLDAEETSTKVAGKRVYPGALKIGERIKAKRKEKGWSQKELGEKAGHTQQICASYERGHSEHPRFLDDFAAALGCTSEELKTGEFPQHRHLRPDFVGAGMVLEVKGERKDPKLHERQLATYANAYKDEHGMVPLVGVVRAGIWSEPESLNSQLSVPRDRLLDWEGDLYALRVEGPSVNRLFPDGSVVFCAPYNEARTTPRSRDLVHAVLRRGQLEEWTIKILNRRENGVIELWPLSTDPRYQEPFRFDPKDEENETRLELKGLVLKGHVEPDANLIRSLSFN